MEERLWFATYEERIATINGMLQPYMTPNGVITFPKSNASNEELRRQLRMMRMASQAYRNVLKETAAGERALVRQAQAAGPLSEARVRKIGNLQVVLASVRNEIDSTLGKLNLAIMLTEAILTSRGVEQEQ